MSGLDLPQPVNYGLVRILPPADTPSDPHKRPFVVVDPRAATAQASAASNPIARSARPQGGSSLLLRRLSARSCSRPDRRGRQCGAEAAFVRRVGELHPAAAASPLSSAIARRAGRF